MRGGGIRGGAFGRGRLAEWDGPWRICRDLCCAVRACSAALPVPAICVSGRRRARTASWWPGYKDSDRGSEAQADGLDLRHSDRFWRRAGALAEMDCLSRG